jgi:hypothetical protein
MTRIALALAVISGCGGGPSVGEVVDPSARIVSSNCQLTGGTVSIDITYDVELDVGQGIESTVQVLDAGAGGGQLDESSFFSCGLWTESGAGQSAEGCERVFSDQPANQTITHQFTATFENPLSPPLDVTVIGQPVDLAGGFGLGRQDVQDLNCF